jgi:tetratricopeptide (TPR) repeat protein
MVHRFPRLSSATFRCGALALAVVVLAGCSSPEERAQRYYEHGMQLLAAHDNKRAAIEFRNAVKYNKKLLPAWQSLAEAEELTQNWNGLIPALRSLVELDPNNATARLKLGRLLLVAGAYDEALKLVTDTKEGDGENADLLSLKAAILFKLKDSAGAVRVAQAALKIDPANAGAMFVLAGDALARGDVKGTLDILNSPDMAKRTDIGTQLFKLKVFEQIKDLNQAEALLNKLVELYPSEVSFKKELIRLYRFQHRDDDAVTEQRSIVATDPTNTTAQLDLVRLLNAIKGPTAAQQELDALIKAGGDTFTYQIALAQLDLTHDKASEGVALLKTLINDASSPDNALTAKINLAEFYLSQKQNDAAAALVSDILNKDARNINALKLRAALRMDSGQFEGSIADLRQALNDQPRAADLILMLASAYERSGSVELAEKEYTDAMKISNYNPSIGLSYVAFLRRRNSAAHAEDVLVDLAGRWPKNVDILSALAQVRLARQEWVGAQEVAELIKSIGTDRTVADEFLGAALAGRNKFDESIAVLQEAYAAEPTATQPMYSLVQVYLRSGKSDQAIAFLQSVLKANPSNVEAYVLLGSVQLANKSPDAAKKNFMTAIEKDPKNVVGYRALSDFYMLQNNTSEALNVTRAGLKEQPDNNLLQLALAGILEKTGDYEGAISEYEKLVAKAPGAVVFSNNLASLLADYRTDKASLDRAQALAAGLQKSSVPQFQDTLGWVSYREGNYKVAVTLLENAATALPNIAGIHYHLGMSYVASGQPDKGAEQLKMALSQAPDHELEVKIRDALSKLGTQ